LQKAGEIRSWYAAPGTPVHLPRLKSQTTHTGEIHTDAREPTAGKGTAQLIRIHNCISVRQFTARQMVVGNDDRYAQIASGLYTFNTGNPVINGDDDIRLLCGCNSYYLWR